MKYYNVSCPATLTFDVEAENPDEAKQKAREEFEGYLRFLSKASDGAMVSSSLEELKAEET